MAYAIAVLIAGLPFSPLLFHNVDIWHAQGFYSQVIIWACFGLIILGSAKQRFINNWPVFLLFLWAGYSTALICYHGLTLNKYNTGSFFTFFNLLTILVLYYSITSYVVKSHIQILVKCLEFVVIFNALICTLQFFGLAQFTKILFPEGIVPGGSFSQMIGFIGNGTHLSAFIGMMFPVLFINKSRRNILAAILSVLVLSLSGERTGDTAATGWIILLFYTFVYLSKRPTAFIALCLVTFIGGWYLITSGNFLNPNGRINIWSNAFQYIQAHFPLTGSGLGTGNLLSGISGSGFEAWRHMHQEYIQFTLELGIIGLVLIINIILDFISTRSCSRIERCLKLSFIGFLISCLFLSSSHLWVMSVYATIVYSLFKVCNKENQWQLPQEKS